MESKGASLHIFKHVLNVYSSLFMQVFFFFLFDFVNVGERHHEGRHVQPSADQQ